jgi:hypothetical protein
LIARFLFLILKVQSEKTRLVWGLDKYVTSLVIGL